MKTSKRREVVVVAYGYGGRDIDGISTVLVHPGCRDAYHATFKPYTPTVNSVYHEDEAGNRPQFAGTCAVCHKAL